MELNVKLRLLSKPAAFPELTPDVDSMLGTTGLRHSRLLPQHKSWTLFSGKSESAAASDDRLKVVGATLLIMALRTDGKSGSILSELRAVAVELFTIDTDEISAGRSIGSVLVPAER